MITKNQYVEYLLSTPINYTCSNLSKHLENVSHDSVTDFLHNSKFLPGDLWDLVKDRIDDSEEAFLLVDDSVQNKQYSQSIETVKLQYSGNVHGLVKGIRLVNPIHTNGSLGDFIRSIIGFMIRMQTAKAKTTTFRRCSVRRSRNRKSKLAT